MMMRQDSVGADLRKKGMSGEEVILSGKTATYFLHFFDTI